MINWTKTVLDYLCLRRALGFKLEWPGKELNDFARLLRREAADYITVPLALKWAHGTASTRRSGAARRLSIARGFSRYVSAIDSRTQIPPVSLLPFRPKRARPYLYTDGEIRALLSAALQLSPDDALRRWTYYVLFGLLSVSGLRIREALTLRLNDVDLQAGVLHVQKAKMGQSRLVPLHASAKQHLIRYAVQASGTTLERTLMKNDSDFSALLQGFFTQRLRQQKQVSSHTIASYRDTFRMLLQFIQRRLPKEPCKLAFEEVDAPLIAESLQDLEKSRRSSARTRNLRLTAIRSFFQYAAYEAPDHAAQIQRVLAIRSKRYDRKQVQFLSQPEIKALVETPDTATWSGRRDRLLLLIAIQTGLRLSELSKLARKDVALATGAHVRCMGKGRKERCTPLTKQAVALLKGWTRELPAEESTRVFPNARGGELSGDGVRYILSKHLAEAARVCPSLQKKKVTPHIGFGIQGRWSCSKPASIAP